MDLCRTCKKMLYRTDPCKGVGAAKCGRTDGGSKVSTGAPVSEPRLDQPTPRKGASRTVPQASHADNREAVTARMSDQAGPVGGRQLQPALRTEVALGPVDHPIIEGATFIAEVPPGTQLKAFGGKIIAAGPGLAPSIVTKDGLVPIQSQADLVPKDKRKGNRHRPGYHADRRAELAKLKAAKDAK